MSQSQSQKRKRLEPADEKRVSHPTEKLQSLVAEQHQQKHQKRLGDMKEEEILAQKAAYLQSTIPFPKIKLPPPTLSFSNTHASEIAVDEADELMHEDDEFTDDDDTLPDTQSQSSSSSSASFSSSSSSLSSSSSSSSALPASSRKGKNHSDNFLSIILNSSWTNCVDLGRKSSVYYDFFTKKSEGVYHCDFTPDYDLGHQDTLRSQGTSHLIEHLRMWHSRLFHQAKQKIRRGESVDKLLQQEYKHKLEKVAKEKLQSKLDFQTIRKTTFPFIVSH